MRRREQWLALAGAIAVVLTCLPEVAGPFAALAVGESGARTVVLVLGLAMAGLAVVLATERWAPSSLVLTSGVALGIALYGSTGDAGVLRELGVGLLLRLAGASAGMVAGLIQLARAPFGQPEP